MEILVGWFVQLCCENLICERKEFIFETFVYFEPVKTFKNRSDVRRFWRSGDSTGKRVLDVGDH